MANKQNVGRKREWARAGAIVVAFLLLLRGLNLPDEMPYLFWIAALIGLGLLLEIAYSASKRW